MKRVEFYYDLVSPYSYLAYGRIGVDPEEVLSGASSPEAKQDLKTATSEAVERGVFGAPAFFVGDEMFWGNDRLHFVEAALQSE